MSHMYETGGGLIWRSMLYIHPTYQNMVQSQPNSKPNPFLADLDYIKLTYKLV